jgi:CheY-like chemotaxis protein
MNATAPGPTLLIVDDDAPLCYLFSFLLNERGYRVISAGSGQEAIKRYRDHSKEIAIVLLDIGLPDLDGLDVLAQLRKINSTVRAVMMSGHTERLTPEQASEPGVVAFLAKPFSIQALIEALAAAGVAPPMPAGCGR